MSFRVVSEHACHGGVQRFYEHESCVIGLPMRFSVFLPPACALEKVPGLLYLAGLTCTAETFATKGGAQCLAAELGIALLAPDTSPRGTGIPGESGSWDVGVGAGFYLDATQEPWSKHWRMESYLVAELLPAINDKLPIDGDRLGIFGHSMGGHGALTLALRHPGKFRSVSAFAPVCASSEVPWGRKAFASYLGEDQALWREHDASALMRRQGTAPWPKGVLVDQGLLDTYLIERACPEFCVRGIT